MYKKIVMILLVSFSFLKAVEIPLNNNIAIDFLNGKTYFFNPVTDISYTQLQNAIKNSSNDSAKIYVYRWYQQPDIIEATFGVNIVGLVEITKNSVKYWLQHTTGNWQSYDSAQDLVNAISEYNSSVSKNKNTFSEYMRLEAFTKLKKYNQYFIKPKGMDLTITFSLPNNSTGNVGTDGLIYPPTPPGIDD